MAQVTTIELNKNILAQLATALADAKCHLFQATLVPDATTKLADLEAAECDFSGYAALDLDFTQPVYVTRNTVEQRAPTVQFDFIPATPPALDVPNNVGGYWVESDAEGVIQVVRFEEAVPMEQVDQALPIDVVIGFGF